MAQDQRPDDTSRTVIDPDDQVATLINVFEVEPARQDELVRLLGEVTENTMRHRPGFVSANIHASVDGQRVINYVQWRTENDFRTMLADPAAQEHMRECLALATSDPRLYTVCGSHHA